MTGGEYGPEGGVLVTGAILLVTVYVSFTKSIYTSDKMKALVFGPAISRTPDPPHHHFFGSFRKKSRKRD